LIYELLKESEAQVIGNIPLSLLQLQDFQIWRGTTNGLFFVQSAYHMEKEYQALNRSGGSRLGMSDTIWKTIWNLNVPNVVKMFL
jgi:hypothetical protein